MAPEEALAPEAALAALHELRAYRQLLTGHAVGIIWMLWGLSMAAVAASDLLSLMVVDDPSVGSNFEVAGLPMVGAIVVAALIATRGVWRAHASRSERVGSRLRTWTLTLVLAAAFLAGAVAAGIWASNLHLDPARFVLLSPALTATTALTLSLTMRGRAQMAPGLGAASVLLAGQFLIPLLSRGSMQEQIVVASSMHVILALTTFIFVGQWHFRRG